MVSGATGTGKSVFLHKVINAIKDNYKNDVKLFLIDSKQVEFGKYKNVENLYKPVAQEFGDSVTGLAAVLDEIENRREQFKQKGVCFINEYNEISEEQLPYIVIVIDEASDLFGEQTVGGKLLKWIARYGNGLGVQLIVSSQMLSPNRLFPELKANLQTRVCFRVAEKEDSFLVVGKRGAERLKVGEFLYRGPCALKITKHKVEM